MFESKLRGGLGSDRGPRRRTSKTAVPLPEPRGTSVRITRPCFLHKSFNSCGPGGTSAPGFPRAATRAPCGVADDQKPTVARHDIRSRTCHANDCGSPVKRTQRPVSSNFPLPCIPCYSLCVLTGPLTTRSSLRRRAIGWRSDARLASHECGIARAEEAP